MHWAEEAWNYFLPDGGIHMEMGVTRSQMRRTPCRPRRTSWQQRGSPLDSIFGRQSALLSQAEPERKPIKIVSKYELI